MAPGQCWLIYPQCEDSRRTLEDEETAVELEVVGKYELDNEFRDLKQVVQSGDIELLRNDVCHEKILALLDVVRDERSDTNKNVSGNCKDFLAHSMTFACIKVPQ